MGLISSAQNDDDLAKASQKLMQLHLKWEEIDRRISAKRTEIQRYICSNGKSEHALLRCSR